MAMKRGGKVKGKKKAVKKRGGGMLEMAMGGNVSPRKKMAMGMAMKRGGSAKKKMAGGGMMAKKKMAKGGATSGAIKKAIASIGGTKPRFMTGRSAAAKKASKGISAARKTAQAKFQSGKGNPAGKDMSASGNLSRIASAFMKRRKDKQKARRQRTPGGGMSPKRK